MTRFFCIEANMTFTLHAFAGQFDYLHLLLAGGIVLLLVKILIKKPAPADRQSTLSALDDEVKPAEPTQEKTHDYQSALQLLALLQQEGRLIDFINEDLTGFSDADIGAAARVVHQGTQKVFQAHLDFVPITKEAEASKITLAPGFDAQAYQLTGNVTGEAPYEGTLIHPGWRVKNISLPAIIEGHDNNIIAKAEVEL